ncbi:MAG: acyl-CoA dehydrogenase family protein [Polyangiales bacterium]
MDWSLSEDEQMIADSVRDFATREVEPKARALDREERWPAELVERMAELGLMGMCVPSAYGGAGLSTLSYALAIEAVAEACASTAVIMSVNNSLVCDPIVHYGTEAQKKAWLPGLASGGKLGCFGLTEPSSGSDAAHMDTVAQQDGGGWVLQGSKNWITNGPHADVMLVIAATDRSLGSKGVSAFLVPTDNPGFKAQPRDEKLGIHAAHSCTVFFEQCRLPADSLLGGVGQGFKIAMHTLDGGRIGIAAQAIGIARAALRKALDYSRERKAFGGVLADKQAIQFKLADMATAIEAAHLLTLRAAWCKDQGGRHSLESATAKLMASEMATRVTHQALQIFGGYGYSKEYDLERHYRDARITEIYEGTSEIMRIVIAAAMLK